MRERPEEIYPFEQSDTHEQRLAKGWNRTMLDIWGAFNFGNHKMRTNKETREGLTPHQYRFLAKLFMEPKIEEVVSWLEILVQRHGGTEEHLDLLKKNHEETEARGLSDKEKKLDKELTDLIKKALLSYAEFLGSADGPSKIRGISGSEKIKEFVRFAVGVTMERLYE